MHQITGGFVALVCILPLLKDVVCPCITLLGIIWYIFSYILASVVGDLNAFMVACISASIQSRSLLPEP